jgi:hypothetical protein
MGHLFEPSTNSAESRCVLVSSEQQQRMDAVFDHIERAKEAERLAALRPPPLTFLDHLKESL